MKNRNFSFIYIKEDGNKIEDEKNEKWKTEVKQDWKENERGGAKSKNEKKNEMIKW